MSLEEEQIKELLSKNMSVIKELHGKVRNQPLSEKTEKYQQRLIDLYDLPGEVMKSNITDLYSIHLW